MNLEQITSTQNPVSDKEDQSISRSFITKYLIWGAIWFTSVSYCTGYALDLERDRQRKKLESNERVMEEFDTNGNNCMEPNEYLNYRNSLILYKKDK